jgi:predicted RNA-binding protein associated with RNAse of E/G family
LSLVNIDERKYPDRLHWQFDVRRLGENEHGVWLYAPPETMARRGHEPPRPIEAGFVLLVPQDEWWIAEFYWDHPWHEVYVNIGTSPVWDGDRMHQIDLDLDVARTVDGSVVVLDEDEFQDHQVRYGYPGELIAAARAATDRAVALLTAGAEPFGKAPEPWLRMVDHHLA